MMKRKSDDTEGEKSEKRKKEKREKGGGDGRGKTEGKERRKDRNKKCFGGSSVTHKHTNIHTGGPHYFLQVVIKTHSLIHTHTHTHTQRWT